ncbi:MAG: ABC transporter permease [Bryobacterales bacterium]|nr:ABC transporter permease [Bryobacterales bacterium]
MLRLAYSFFRRDAAIAFSYRFAFFAQFTGNILLLGLLYYVGQMIGPRALPSLDRYGGNFLAFALVGVALTDTVMVSLISFGQQVREAQTTGTLEATLMSPVPLWVILIFSSLWNYFLSAFRFALYLVVGAFLYGLHLGQAHMGSVLIIFALTVLCFMGAGMAWAAIVLVIKRGEALMTLIVTAVLVLSGVIFPPSVLPGWLQSLGALIPLTDALDGMRIALLQGASPAELAGPIGRLTVFSIVFLLLGVIGFDQAVRIGRRNGSLTQY